MTAPADAHAGVQALRSAGIERAGVANAWQKCNAQLGRDGEIDVVEEELAASEGGVSGRPARVLLNPTIRINGAQYRGDLATVRTSRHDPLVTLYGDAGCVVSWVASAAQLRSALQDLAAAVRVQASVVKAICAAYPDHREPAFCRAAGAPDCTAGGAGTAQCARNAAMHRSRCLDTFMGFDCLCDVGYTATQNEVGEASCVDVNECVVADPCDLANNPRSACHNTQGSFRCGPAPCRSACCFLCFARERSQTWLCVVQLRAQYRGPVRERRGRVLARRARRRRAVLVR